MFKTFLNKLLGLNSKTNNQVKTLAVLTLTFRRFRNRSEVSSSNLREGEQICD